MPTMIIPDFENEQVDLQLFGSPASGASYKNMSHNYRDSKRFLQKYQDYGVENKEFIEKIQMLVDKIPPTIRNSVIASGNCSIYGAITYNDLAEHLLSLRTEYIQRIGRPILQKLFYHPKNSNIFNQPVDPIAQNIPNYFDVITSPMDLGTIRSRLNSSFYQTLTSCFEDIRLVFNNAIYYNGKESYIGKLATDLLHEFETEITGIEEKSLKNVRI
jgi:hypothetical protein